MVGLSSLHLSRVDCIFCIFCIFSMRFNSLTKIIFFRSYHNKDNIYPREKMSVSLNILLLNNAIERVISSMF